MVEVSPIIPSSARIVLNPVFAPRPPLASSNVVLLLQAPPPPPSIDLPCNPLDLSCKSKPSTLEVPPSIEPFGIRRANSCSTGSGSGSGSLFSDEEKRQKRKEQNKAAAQSYRQRKKSFSGLIETEVEQLSKRNVQLKAQKQKLEDQIAKIRSLLNEVVEDSKRSEEAISDTASEPPLVQSPSWSMDGSSFNGEEVQQMRSRKYTWPMALSGKDRKKEQNKLASRRFRQRRKQEMSHCELEAQQLESNNKKLKERIEELENKIKLLKDLMNKNNAMLDKQQLMIKGSNGN